MKTIKIIDLLNKIANGEEVPKRIIYNNVEYTYEYDVQDYWKEEHNYLFEKLFCENGTKIALEIEVEILDEEDEFEDIEEMDVALLGQCDNWLRCPTNEVTKQDIELNPYIINNIRENTLEFQHRINDLIKNQKKIIEMLNDVKDKR